MAWVEMSYMSYVSSVNDLVISEISRTAKKHSGDYLETVHRVLNQESSIWNPIVDAKRFNVSIQYLQGLTELTAYTNKCQMARSAGDAECGQARNAAIAVYHIDYEFRPIFSYFLGLQGLMSREMVVVQEYERTFFSI